MSTVFPFRYSGDHVAEKAKEFIDVKAALRRDTPPFVGLTRIEAENVAVEDGEVTDDVFHLK